MYSITSSEIAFPDVPEYKRYSEEEVCVLHSGLASAEAALCRRDGRFAGSSLTNSDTGRNRMI